MKFILIVKKTAPNINHTTINGTSAPTSIPSIFNGSAKKKAAKKSTRGANHESITLPIFFSGSVSTS